VTEQGGAEHQRGLASWRGIVLGVVFGMLTAAAWYGIVWASGTRHPYFMSAVGITSAYGVYAGSRTEGKRGAWTSVIITVCVLVFAVYWVERHLVERWFADNGDSISIPIIPYFDWLEELLWHAFSTSFLPALFAALAIASAAFFGYVGFAADEPRHTAEES
jgi:hypothetical protein